MFQGEINRRRGIVLVRLTGRLQPSEIGKLEEFGRKIDPREGPLDIIVDFSAVEEIDMPVNYIAQRGEKAPLWPGRQRVFVAPQPVLHALMRLFASYQALHGMGKPVVVTRLDEALERLDTSLDEFQAIDREPPTAVARDACPACS